MMVSLRPDPVDTIDTGTPRHFFEKRYVTLGFAWQVVVTRDTRARLRLHPGKRLIDRLALGEHVEVGGPFVDHVLAVFVAGAHLNLVEAIEHIELRERDAVEPVDPNRVACDDRVVPPAAARTAGDRSQILARCRAGDRQPVPVSSVGIGPSPTRVA